MNKSVINPNSKCIFDTSKQTQSVAYTITKQRFTQQTCKI